MLDANIKLHSLFTYMTVSHVKKFLRFLSFFQVKYKWSYLVGNVPTKVKRIARPRPLLIKKESVRAIEEEIEALQSTFDEEEEESGDSFRIKLEEEGEEDNQTSYESLRKQTFDERKLSLLREVREEKKSDLSFLNFLLLNLSHLKIVYISKYKKNALHLKGGVVFI